jgi:6-phosphogluconolactonase
MTPEKTLIVVACPGAGAVDVVGLDAETGQLEPISRTDGLEGVSALAIDAHGTGYAGCNAGPRGPQLVELSLGEDGSVAQGTSIDLPATTCFLSLERGHPHVFSASYADHRLDRVTVPGGPHGERLLTFDSGRNSHCAALSPDGRFVYATSLGGDRVSWFSTDFPAGPGGNAADDGVIKPVGKVAAEAGSGPRYLRLNSRGDRAYVVHELSGDVAVYARDSETGGLELVQRISAVEGLGLKPGVVRGGSTPDPGADVVWAADLRLTPDERFLFTTERSTSMIAAFSVAEDGVLEFLGWTPTETQPCGSVIDPSGRFLIVSGEGSSHVTAYRIGEDGSLTAVSRAETSNGPVAVECWRPLR